MLSKIIPSSLFIRFILIIAIPIIFAQLIATYIFYNRHWESVSKHMAVSLSNDIQIVIALEHRNIGLVNKQEIYDKIGIQYSQVKLAGKFKDHFDSEAEYLYRSLKESIDLPINISFIDNADNIRIQILKANSVQQFVTNAKRINNPTTYIFILWMTGTSLIFILLSIIFAKNQIRPIIKLARAADRFGKGQQTLGLKPEGAKEITKAAIAFLKMKERIERQISYRTEMLAGISHDLRTPLTRLKLQLALSKSQENVSMLEDVKDMEVMVNSYLDFVRGDGREDVKSVWLDKYLTRIFRPYIDQDVDLIVNKVPHIRITLKVDTIKRCFQNLLDNAFKYGSKAIVSNNIVNDELIIEIHDNGPGIPESKREDVFKPFFRIEESRNKETGGIGLGLAITRDLVSNHGGRIYLEESELLQGLKVVVALPL